MAKTKDFYELMQQVLTMLILTGQLFHARTSTSKPKIAESGMLGQRKFLPYSEMSRTEWKLSGHFCNTAMSTTLQA